MLRVKKIISPKIIILIVIFILIIYLINEFILNKELGQNIYLYKTKDCVDTSYSSYRGLENCFIYGMSFSIHLLYPKTLYDGLNYVLNTYPERERVNNGNDYLINTLLKKYPKNPSDWICALTPSGKIVENNDKEKIKPDSQYKCWLKNR